MKVLLLGDTDSARPAGPACTGLELLQLVGLKTLSGAGFSLYQAQLLSTPSLSNRVSAFFFWAASQLGLVL